MRIVIIGEDAGRAAEFNELLSDFGLDWQVDWVAVDAVDAAIATPADAFVCGLRVDKMGGAELLAKIASQHPQAVRILLLDQGTDGGQVEIGQGVDSAQRVLARPLDASELVAAVESVIELRELLDSETLKRAVGRISSLPPPPRLYLQLVRLLRDPDASTNAIAQALSQDPAIAAKVLRLCNSAYFSGGREIGDMRTAVTRLGQQTLLRLVLTIEAFGASAPGSSESREAMQDRAMRTSALARRILPGSSAEMAATAALLAEVGRLLPGVSSGAEGEEGPGYAEAGAYLLGLWGLPMPIVEGVAYHRQPARQRTAGFWLAGAVHVASSLVTEAEPDEAYLRSVGMLDNLPKWRDYAEQLKEQGAA